MKSRLLMPLTADWKPGGPHGVRPWQCVHSDLSHVTATFRELEHLQPGPRPPESLRKNTSFLSTVEPVRRIHDQG